MRFNVAIYRIVKEGARMRLRDWAHGVHVAYDEQADTVALFTPNGAYRWYPHSTHEKGDWACLT